MKIAMSRNSSMTFGQKFWQINWLLIALLVVLAFIGCAMLYSAGDASWDPWAKRHLIRFGVGLLLMIIVAIIDIRIWLRHAYTLGKSWNCSITTFRNNEDLLSISFSKVFSQRIFRGNWASETFNCSPSSCISTSDFGIKTTGFRDGNNINNDSRRNIFSSWCTCLEVRGIDGDNFGIASICMGDAALLPKK